MAAPSFVAAANTTYASRSNTSVTKPTGTVDDDLVVLVLINGRNGSYGPAPTAPSGFTLLPSMPVQVNEGGFYLQGWVYYKVASGEGASWAFTHSTITTQAFALTYRGVDTTTPIDVTGTSNITTSAGAVRNWTGITTVTADAMLVVLGWDWADTSNNLTPPTGFTERLEVNPLVYAAEKVQASPGATGNFSHTSNSGGGLPRVGYLMALRPVASGVTGTLVAIFPKVTGSSSGTVGATGTLVAVFPKVTGSFSGTVGVTGTLGATFPIVTGSSAGTVAVSGTPDASLPLTTAAIAGTVALMGTLDATFPLVTSSIEGTVEGGPVTGTLDAAFPMVTGDVSGTAALTGTLDAALPLATASISGVVDVTGALGAAFPFATSDISGTVEDSITGAIDATFPKATSSAAGTVGVTGTLVSVFPVVTSSVTGTVEVTGTTAGAFPLVTAFLAENELLGTLAATFPKFAVASLSGTYTPKYVFVTPTRQIQMSESHRLYKRVPYPMGTTVLKEDGIYRQVGGQTDPVDIDNAEMVYLGGHEYVLTEAEVSELTAAGYGEFITSS